MCFYRSWDVDIFNLIVDEINKLKKGDNK